MEELLTLCPGAKEMQESGHHFVFLPQLPVNGTKQDSLLCLTARDGYPTRLFLAQPIAGKGNNWTVHQILGRTWHTCSWKIEAAMNPAQILAEHLRAYR